MLIRVAFSLMLVVATSACSSLTPRHTVVPVGSHVSANCEADGLGAVPESCGSQMYEVGDGYVLHFAEFDDHGNAYPEGPEYGAASQQVSRFLEAVELQVDQPGDQPGVSLVVFIHGWLHSAKANDDNLKSFRRLLRQLAVVENRAFCRRRIVGLYVGWRGSSTVFSGHPTDTASFWSRKAAAQRLATGSMQVLIGGLKAIQDAGVTRDVALRSESGANCSSRLKTMYVGHSFGGLAILTAMSQDILNGLMRDRRKLSKQALRAVDPLPGSLDQLVIAINPAMEGGRVDALFRTADPESMGSIKSHHKMPYETYRSPRLVIITSKDDWATRSAFPVGRWFSTALQRFPKNSPQARRSEQLSIGHDSFYINRLLVTGDQYLDESASGPDGGPPLNVAEVNRREAALNAVDCKRWNSAKSYSDRAAIDVDMAREFYSTVKHAYDANDIPERVFCANRSDKNKRGLIVLSRAPSKQVNLNSPLWNIYTRAPIIVDHNDINNVQLIEFLRRLYVESLFFD